MLLKSRIEKALKQVTYPPTGQDVFAAGIVQSLTLKDKTAILIISVEASVASGLEDMRKASEAAMAGVRGVESARVILTAQASTPKPPQHSPAAASPHPRHTPPTVRHAPVPPHPERLKSARHVIAIASGKGGVGKSTTSVNLAYALAGKGLKIGLVDCDIYGPSIAKMLGLTERAQVNENKHIRPQFRDGVAAMSMGVLMNTEDAAVWRGPMVMKATQQLLTEVAWDERGQLDVLIIDLPPGTGDVQLTMTQNVILSGAIIVSTPQDLALIDARKAYSMFQKVSAPVLGIVENMSYFHCPSCGERADIFGHGGARETAREYNLPFLGEIPLHMSIREAGDSGNPFTAAGNASPEADAYRQIADQVWQRLQQTNPAST